MFGILQVSKSVDTAKEIVAIPNENFTIFGVLSLIIVGLIVAVIYLARKYSQSYDFSLKIVGKYESLASQVMITVNEIKNLIMVKK